MVCPLKNYDLHVRFCYKYKYFIYLVRVLSEYIYIYGQILCASQAKIQSLSTYVRRGVPERIFYTFIVIPVTKYVGSFVLHLGFFNTSLGSSSAGNGRKKMNTKTVLTRRNVGCLSTHGRRNTRNDSRSQTGWGPFAIEVYPRSAGAHEKSYFSGTLRT